MTKYCSKCYNEVPEDAINCPRCGQDLRDWYILPSIHEKWQAVAFVLFLVFIGMCACIVFLPMFYPEWFS